MSKLSVSDKKNWVFDLDNTIYPAENDIFVEMNDKICSYIMDLLKIDNEGLFKFKKKYFKDYGTTLDVLIKNYNVDPIDFLNRVHDLDYSVIKYNKDLKNILQKAPNEKYIHTNGIKSHCDKVLDKLEISNLFNDCFDIIEANFIAKPQQKNYDIMQNRFNIDFKNTVFFEDMAKNLVVPKKMGMTTVWIYTEQTKHQYDEYKDYIDYAIDDLVKFLSF